MRKKEPGRPKGSTTADQNPRNRDFKTRVSDGFIDALAAMVANGLYKSKTDALHEAVANLATKKLSSKNDFSIINRI